MVQEASLDDVALAGAMAAALFAALTYMLGRQRHATPAMMWWAAAFAVEAHDGRLTIESVFGEGSIATLHLPASRLLRAAARQRESP